MGDTRANAIIDLSHNNSQMNLAAAMLTSRLLCTLALCLLTVTGCANLSGPARRHPLDAKGTYWFDYAADRRGSIMVPTAVTDARPSGVIICAEPAPDVAQNFVNS